jgi:hypothetical protein
VYWVGGVLGQLPILVTVGGAQPAVFRPINELVPLEICFLAAVRAA